MNNDLEQYAKNSFADSELEFMANGNNPVANAYRELLTFRRAAKQAKPVGYATRDENYDWHIDFCGETHCLSQGDSLYTTPQPAHTEQDNPVAWLLSGGGAKNIVSFDSGNAYADPSREVTPLYTTPQTRHAGLVSWIECRERMPETYLNVLLTDEADDMCIGQLESHDDTDFFVVGCQRYKATHWMPLPAAPKPESE